MVRTSHACTASPADAALHDNTPSMLALQASDDVQSLREVLDAFICLERLVTPIERKEPEDFGPTRSELGAMLSLLNEVFRQRLGTAVDAVDTACSAAGRSASLS